MSSFPMDKPRRQPPSPLNFQHSQSSYHTKASQPSPSLLYDLPSAVSMSPPTSPKSPASPPTSPGRSRPHRNSRPSPSPSGRKRSMTPLGVATSDLEQFAAQCRSWYFKQDEEAGKIMTQTMANLPSNQRAAYSRLQSSIRSAYHKTVNARRNAEFRAHLSATQPGASLPPHTRSNPRGPEAQRERYQRFERFVRSWCTMGMPGPQPFFQALWAVMRLQTVPEDIGGAGKQRIEWEFDDAVLKESAGKDFMLEAIDILKGVLGFDEVLISRTLSAPSNENAGVTHSRSPFVSEGEAGNVTQPKRARAPSDPFLDTPALSRSVGTSYSNSTSLLTSDNSEEPLSPVPAAAEEGVPMMESYDDSEEDEEFMRTWTSPDLTNPEYLNLVKVFPSHITRRTLPYFSTVSSKDPSDLEAGLTDSKTVRCGTGTLRVSPLQRTAGWEGSWWSRFLMWWRRLFG